MERLAVVVSGVLAAGLVASLTSSADGGERPKLRFNAADQAAAHATVIRHADLNEDVFSGSSSWTGGSVKPDFTPWTCANFHPKQSDLTVTGAAENDWSDDTGSIQSQTWVLQNSRMVKVDWQRSATEAGFICQLTGLGARKISASRVAVPRLTPMAAAYRATFNLKQKGETRHLVLEVAEIGQNRSELFLAEATDLPARLGVIHADVLRLARIMLSRTNA